MELTDSYVQDKREIALDMMSAVPVEDPLMVATSLIQPDSFTLATLANLEKAIETDVVQSMSVVAARAFNPELIMQSNIPLHSVDHPLYTGLKEIATAYVERLPGQHFNPKKLIKGLCNLGGEYLMHSDEKNGSAQTISLLQKMESQKQFGLLRLDSTQGLTDIHKTQKAIEIIKSKLNGSPLYAAVELKYSPILPTLDSNLNAYEELKQKLLPFNVHLSISLDVRALQEFANQDSSVDPNQYLLNLLTQNPEKIGLMELSGPEHTSPFNDPFSMEGLTIVQDQEKHDLNRWAIPKKLSLVIETHPIYFRTLLQQLSDNRGTLS